MAESEISKKAAQLAKENPPGIVLENAILGLFAAIGWVLGRVWFYGSKLVFIIWLAFADGYMKGVKHAPQQPQALPSEPAPPMIFQGHPLTELQPTPPPPGVPLTDDVLYSAAGGVIAHSEPG